MSGECPGVGESSGCARWDKQPGVVSRESKGQRAEQQRTSLEKVKPYLEVLVAGIAVASFILSIKGCRDTERANRTAEDALETSQHQFIQINRPYVVLMPKKGGDGKYWHLAQQDRAVLENIRYEVRNDGKAPVGAALL